MADTTVPSPALPTRGSQPRWAARTGFAYAPRAVRVGIVVIVVLGLTAAGYYSRIYSQTRARERDEAAAWRSFDEAAATADFATMDAALDRLLTLRPGDLAATARKAALASGSADPDDTRLAAALVSRHLGQDRLVEAAREARKVIARDPKHWRSLCVLAHHAISMNRDPNEARRWLDTLPDPGDPHTRFDAGGLLHAVRLSDHVGRDSAPLRRAIVVRVLPVLRGGAPDSVSPLGRVQLIECYLEPFADRSILPQLLDHWGEVSRLLHSAVARAENTDDTIALIQLGQLGHRLREALRQFHQHELVPDERFALLARALDDQTRHAWLAVHAREPGRVELYSGLAVLAVAAGDYRQAVEQLLAGIAICGDRPELVELLARLAAATGNADVAVTLTRTAAQKDPTNSVKWCRAAQMALAAGQHDVALAACEKARSLAPNDLLACRIQASIWLEMREAGKAIDLLWSLGEGMVRADPGLLRLAVRALAEAGGVTTAEAIADELEHRERDGLPRRSIAAVRGLLDSRGDPDVVALAAVRSLRLAAHWTGDSHAWRLVGDAHYRLAECSLPPWPADVARTAIKAYEQLPRTERTTPDVIAAVAALQLNSLKDAAAAWQTLAPLRDPAALPILTAHQRGILAAARLARNKVKPDSSVPARTPVRGDQVPGDTVSPSPRGKSAGSSSPVEGLS